MGKRLIFYGGARERNNNGSQRRQGIGANNTFHAAALGVRQSYGETNVRMIRISTAAEVVHVVNGETDGSILSMDVLSHGTPWTLNFSREDDVNCGFFGNRQIRLMNDAIAPNSDDVNAFGNGSASLTDIHFQKFVIDARVEFHGCNTANTDDPDFPPEIRRLGRDLIISKTVSEQLHIAGRTSSYVIGHATSSTPNMGGGRCDYRHGKRVVYHNGHVLFETRQEGHLRHEDVQRRLSDVARRAAP